MMSKPTQPLSPWLQDLSALGLLPLATRDPPTESQQNRRIPQLALSAHAGDLQSRRDWQMLQQYTPQPLDMGQFQPRPQLAQIPVGPPTVSAEYRRRFMPQFPLVTTASIGSVVPPVADSLQVNRTANSIVNCPVPLCGRGFSDANALKHHMSFDHPQDLRNSNPGSPADKPVQADLTPPVFASNRSSFNGSAISQPQTAQVLSASTQDRNKAPHWVDANVWSSWIAAANGNGDAATLAQATAMGITPGIGGPQTFLPQQQQQQFSQQRSENELLQMFDSVTSGGDQMTLDQQLAMMESVLNTNGK
ncbi:hypothetical protein EC988_002812 [Linderina pennispora]|nr:hypothetical protein EC988_002812 [Linderina pennispora]